MKLRNEEDLKRRWLADAETGLVDPEAHTGELTSGQRWRRFRIWFSAELDAWTTRLERGGRWAKNLAIIVTSMATVGAVLWRAAVFYKTRGLSPAETRKTGIASTTIDRVADRHENSTTKANEKD